MDFTDGQLAIIERSARLAAEETVKLHGASFREEARKVAEATAAAAAGALAATVKEAAHTDAVAVAKEQIKFHADGCPLKIAFWKLAAMLAAASLGGGGVVKILGG